MRQRDQYNNNNNNNGGYEGIPMQGTNQFNDMPPEEGNEGKTYQQTNIPPYMRERIPPRMGMEMSERKPRQYVYPSSLVLENSQPISRPYQYDSLKRERNMYNMSPYGTVQTIPRTMSYQPSNLIPGGPGVPNIPENELRSREEPRPFPPNLL